MLCVWDINGDLPCMTHEFYGTELESTFIEEGIEEGVVYKTFFNNPEAFHLEKRLEILGTRGGIAAFQVSAISGLPEMTDKAYTLNQGHSVKTAIPLKAELLPDMEKTEIPVGTNLTPYQTDGKSFIDLKTETGGIIRLSIDVSGWPRMVNGMPEEECFEELLYAG